MDCDSNAVQYLDSLLIICSQSEEDAARLLSCGAAFGDSLACALYFLPGDIC